MRDEINNSDDMIDLRDVIARIEEIEDSELAEEKQELASLVSFIGECKGNGGDEQWRGDWYPITAVRDSYFVEYTKELLEDCGDLPKDLPHYIEIDWHATARNIRTDYTAVEFDGVTYWVR